MLSVSFSGGSSLRVLAMLKEKSSTVHATSFVLASTCQNYGSEEAEAKINVSKAVSCGMLGHQTIKINSFRTIGKSTFPQCEGEPMGVSWVLDLLLQLGDSPGF